MLKTILRLNFIFKELQGLHKCFRTPDYVKSLSGLGNTQLDVAHNSYNHTQQQLQPLLPAEGTGPRTKQNTQDFSLLSESRQCRTRPVMTLLQTTLVLVYCMNRGALDAFWKKRFSPESEKYSLSVLRVCCCQHLSFISQQRICWGKDSRAKHGGFIGATRPKQNKSQQLASFLFHLVHCNSVSCDHIFS